MPTLGTVPGAEGLVVVTGHGANGLLLGPLSGRLAAELALGETPTIDEPALSPARWSRHP